MWIKDKMKGKKSNKITSKFVRNMLGDFLGNITETYKEKPSKILDAWPEIIGEKFAHMTKAVSIKNKILTVNVSNSTLYSLLCQHEKITLLKKLQKKFSKEAVQDIRFRIG